MRKENNINEETNQQIENSLKKLNMYKKSIQAYGTLQESLYLQAKSLFVNPEDDFIFEYLFCNVPNPAEHVNQNYDNMVNQKIIENLKIV
jgi:hypothetical protein